MEDDLSLDVTDFEKKLGEKQVFYLSMPNNPTGYTSTDDLRIIIEAMEERLAQKEEMMWRDFNQLELVISQLQTQSSYLQSQMTG